MNNTIVLVLQLIIAISALIILHEIGHFAAARFFKIDVEEFGIGFPPRALRLWRRKSKFKLGSTVVDYRESTLAQIIAKVRAFDFG